MHSSHIALPNANIRNKKLILTMTTTAQALVKRATRQRCVHIYLVYIYKVLNFINCHIKLKMHMCGLAFNVPPKTRTTTNHTVSII